MTSLAHLHVSSSVARLVLNRPDARNALSIELLDALHERVDELAGRVQREKILVTTITGEGKAFCAGMDLKQIVGNPEGSRRLLHRLAELTYKLRALPCVVLGVVNGAAIGGGAGIATVCDVSITFPDSKFGFPEVDLGICPAVVTPWLVKKIGVGGARGVFLAGGLMSGAEAHARGIITHLAKSAIELPAEAEAIVKRLCGGGAHALQTTKAMLNDLDHSLDLPTLKKMADLSADVLNTPETQAMLRARLVNC